MYIIFVFYNNILIFWFIFKQILPSDPSKKDTIGQKAPYSKHSACKQKS